MLGTVYGLSYLMVSSVKYLSFKHAQTDRAKKFQVKENDDVREVTRRPSTLPSRLRTSSVTPSEKKSCSGIGAHVGER